MYRYDVIRDQRSKNCFYWFIADFSGSYLARTLKLVDYVFTATLNASEGCGLDLTNRRAAAVYCMSHKWSTRCQSNFSVIQPWDYDYDIVDGHMSSVT